jgi:hypothetical protein
MRVLGAERRRIQNLKSGRYFAIERTGATG